jgi:hypothetical protein
MGFDPSELCSRRVAVRRLRRRSPLDVGPRSLPSRPPAPPSTARRRHRATEPSRSSRPPKRPPLPSPSVPAEPKPCRSRTCRLFLGGRSPFGPNDSAHPSEAETPSEPDASPRQSRSSVGKTCCPALRSPKAPSNRTPARSAATRRPRRTGHTARLSGIRRYQPVRAAPFALSEIRRSHRSRRLQPDPQRAEAPRVPNELPAPAEARRPPLSRAAPPLRRDPRAVVFQACITLRTTETEITAEPSAPPARVRRPKAPVETEWAIRSRPEPEDSAWNRTAPASSRPKSRRAEHLRSFLEGRSPFGPNER